MAWILAFSGGYILLAELLLLALLVVLARVFGRLSREAAADRERLAFRLPVALYTGWVSLAMVPGTAATGVWLGLPGDGALAAIAAVRRPARRGGDRRVGGPLRHGRRRLRRRRGLGAGRASR